MVALILVEDGKAVELTPSEVETVLNDFIEIRRGAAKHAARLAAGEKILIFEPTLVSAIRQYLDATETVAS